MQTKNGFLPKIFLATMIIVSSLLMIGSSLHDSLIMDELAHIPAGYGYLKFNDYRLNPEHPPLTKVLSAIPLVFMDLKFPTESKAWTTDINGQWDAGREFIFGSGNDADILIFWARLGAIFLTIVLTLIIYYVSKKLTGPALAFLPTALFAFSPSVLAHGHYVTTDIAAAFGILISLYSYANFLKKPTVKNGVFATICFGLAQLSKFSAVLLIPFYIAIAIIWGIYKASKIEVAPLKKTKLRMFFELPIKELFRLAVVGIAATVLMIYPTYFVFTRNYPIERQAQETEYLLSSFAEGPTKPGETCNPMRCIAEATIWMAGKEATRPFAEYALGVLMVTQRETGGNTSYFLGEVSNLGSRTYFPVVFGLKETPLSLLLLFAAIIFAVYKAAKSLKENKKVWARILLWTENNIQKVIFLMFIVFYMGMSIKSPLNIGYRHLMPILPLVYILIASAFASLKDRPWHYLAMIFIVFFGAIHAFAVYPYYLSYFNFIGGGTENGYRYVTDSNYDWGQDLYELENFIEKNPQIDKIAVDFFGGSNVDYYLKDKAVSWWSAKGNPADQGIPWFAVSVNNLQGSIQPKIQWLTRYERDEYRWLTSIREKESGMGGIPKPDYRIGTSILIYKL